MDEARFWSLIETAWKPTGSAGKLRQKLAEGKLAEDKAEEAAETLMEAMETVIPALEEQLEALDAAELMAFDRIAEGKLYDIDRADVHEFVDGSDDGFLYGRGFILALGQAYYDAVNAKPALAVMDAECEEMCYIAWHIYQEKFGEMPPSDISRETCSNKAGWPEME